MIISHRHQLIGVPIRPDLLNLFPQAMQVNFEGKDLILLKHGYEETTLLRNLGFSVPAPIVEHYDWEGGKPFDVQIKTAAMLTQNRRAYVLNGMGTGKTKAALWSWRFLNRQGQANKALVIAHLSTLNFTWGREIFNTLPGVRYSVLHGTRAKRLERLADPDVDIFIINHDGLQVIAEELEKRDDIDTLIIDELATYRNGQSNRTKLTRKVARRFKWVWGMTGSPTPNAPTDAWGQCSIVTPYTIPKFFGRFRDEVMQKITQFKWAPKHNSLDRVFEVMQPAVRFTLDDVVELPEVVERTVDIEMGPKQAKVYKQMEEQAFTMVSNKEITAMNAGAVLSKLLQISTGYVYDREGNTVALDNGERLDALVDAVAATDRKVLLFVPFVHALDGIASRLIKEGIDVATVSGQTSKPERDQTFNIFQNTSGIRVIVAHPQCTAHGITLTAADTIIWFAPTTSLEIFEQTNARIRRVGQKHKQLILMFSATKAERQMYARLRAKQKVQNLLLEMFANQTQSLPTE